MQIWLAEEKMSGDGQNFTRVIDADADLEKLRERVNAHFALPKVVSYHRNNVLNIAADKMETFYNGSGGGCYYTCTIILRPAPILET